MTKPGRQIMWLYIQLLRLYPPRFRQEFAAEMQDVFALALYEAEQQGSFAIIRLYLSELSDLPLSLVREHLRERRQGFLLQEVGMPQNRLLLRHYRFYSVSLLLTITLYALLIILPFYAYGLHLQPTVLVANGAFDPKGYPLYASPIGYAASFVTAWGYLWLIAAGIILAFTLVRYWPRLRISQRRLGTFVVIASAALLVFIGTPPGRLILQWLLD